MLLNLLTILFAAMPYNPEACLRGGEACEKDSQCCLGVVCNNAKCCVFSTQPCNTNEDCCSYRCTHSGFGESSGKSPGESFIKSFSEAFGEPFEMSLGKSCCLGRGGICEINEACCSGQCHKGRCTCLPSQFECTYDEDCCGTLTCTSNNVCGHHN